VYVVVAGATVAASDPRLRAGCCMNLVQIAHRLYFRSLGGGV